MFTRRGFLNTLTGVAAAERLSRVPALAAGEDYRALVCVFLFGGNDCNNMVVPLGTQEFQSYQTSRGTLALARNTLRELAAPGGAGYGLHPRLTDLQELFAQKKAAIIANVGMMVRPVTRDQYRQRAVPLPVNLFSHSDQQLQWQSAISAGGARYGWGGLAADSVAARNADRSLAAISLSGNTLFLLGRDTRPALVDSSTPTGLTFFSNSQEQQARLRAFQEILTSDEGYLLVQAANQVTAEGIRIASQLSSTLTTSPRLNTAFPATTLGRQMEQIARLVRARDQLGASRQLFFAAVGGWDTHTGQIASHDSLMAQLGPALAALYKGTEELGVASQVTTFTASEFGRTLNPNTNAGSDHGWGSHHFVIGGAVRGGQLYGRFPTVALNGPDDASGRGVWVPTTSLDQYGATLAAWFGVPEQALAEVFPNLGNFATANLGFLG
jgi:uncharacterized protein (DUF1501 family)